MHIMKFEKYEIIDVDDNNLKLSSPVYFDLSKVYRYNQDKDDLLVVFDNDHKYKITKMNISDFTKLLKEKVD